MTTNQESDKPTWQDVLTLHKRVYEIIDSPHHRDIYKDLQPFYVAARDYKFKRLDSKRDTEQAGFSGDDGDPGSTDAHLQAAIQAYPGALAALERSEAAARTAPQETAARSAAQVRDTPTATNSSGDTGEAPQNANGAGSRHGPPSWWQVPGEALPPGVTVRMVAIKDIVIPPNREPDPDIVRQLVASIDNLGLLNPIILTPDGDLVAGRNRVAAVIELKHSHIEARIEMWSTIDRQLVEIDENLVRGRLTLLRRGRLLARRKELYEAIHPEAQQHARGGHAKAAANGANEIISPAPAFASDAAAKLGTSERTVQEEIRIATNLSPEAAELIEGTALEDEKVKLMELTRLPRDQQATVVQMLFQGRAKSVSRAVTNLQRGAQQADASTDKPENGEPTKNEASAGGTPHGGVPMNEPRETEFTKTTSKGRAARAVAVLEHLEAAMRLLPDLRAEGLPPGRLADEVDAAVEKLATLQADVKALVKLLTPRGRGRGNPHRPRANVEARRGRSAA